MKHFVILIVVILAIGYSSNIVTSKMISENIVIANENGLKSIPPYSVNANLNVTIPFVLGVTIFSRLDNGPLNVTKGFYLYLFKSEIYEIWFSDK